MEGQACPTAVKFLGILGIAIGMSLTLSGLGTMIGAFSQIPSTRDTQALFIFWLAVARFLMLGIASIFLGVGFLDGKRWAWFGTLVLALVLSVVAFLKFKTGILIGVIVVFTLFRSDVRAFFRIGISTLPPPTS